MVVVEETFFNENFKSGFQDFLTITEVRSSLTKGPANTKPIVGLSYATNEVTQLVTGCESSKFFHRLVCGYHFFEMLEMF